MFRIRRIYDDFTPLNKDAILQVREILRTQFGLLERALPKLGELLRNPLKHGFRAVLFVAEEARGRVRGFALLSHAPDLDFCYLDFISTSGLRPGRGVGGALYERVREESLALGAAGLFFECLPDDPRLSPDPAVRRQNAARLRFYEKYGARPIVGTAYETPLRPGEPDPPYLTYDGLGRGRQLRRDSARRIVRAILERKYGHVCPPGYIETVVQSFRDDPVRLRRPRYQKSEPPLAIQRSLPFDQRVALVVTDQHAIHHVRERGYVESPVRIRKILAELQRVPIFTPVKIRRFPDRHIKAVHDPQFVDELRQICQHMAPGKSLYPYVFPIRNATRPPEDRLVRAGYYCIDTFTPLNRTAYQAARRAVDCALTAAEQLLQGQRLAYTLVRPPGHHAERRYFGGFCYLNSAAVAAQYLSEQGPVAMLDLDYHHGNGQQDIFYERADVLTISIHGHPRFAYPYFAGFADERGSGAGRGYNLNLPLPEQLDGPKYREHLRRALKRLRAFQPKFLVLLLGLDTAKGDPTGTWSLLARDFEENGKLVGELALPTLVVQEGGYDNRVLGTNARHFLTGLWSGAFPLTEPRWSRPVKKRTSPKDAGSP